MTFAIRTATSDRLVVRDSTAAHMLDLSKREFLRLVALGALPRPVSIGGHDRWRIDTLDAILRGDAAKPRPDQDIAV